eukprot:TRINITY_DN15756_c0_g1_i1.p1 TRINITY_DN15756_c0_g1~~TRINITY_DN15756_c0_g1_i1.p1  ORF type:complete len:616 (-),score=231.15 TRINITY_DN15756_c0_g1_i1:943-2790(-)
MADSFTQPPSPGLMFTSASSPLPKLRSLVQTYISHHQYSSALYWADKLVTLSMSTPKDMHMLAHCLLLTKQYHRASHLVVSNKLHTTHMGCCYMAAKALHMAGEQEEALLVLEEGEEMLKEEELQKEIEDQTTVSSIYLLKGYILEALDNRPMAAEAFQAALRADVFCQEAFEALVGHQMLTAEEERELLHSLPFQDQEDPDLASFLYSSSLKKYSCPEDLDIPAQLEPLKDNSDLLVCKVERLFYNCDYHAAFKLSSNIIKSDPYHARCLPIHIALLVELKKTNCLFQVAHSLVDLYPEWSTSWFAVGCYYYLSGRQDPARRFLSKATQLDRLSGPAWLAYGHSFAVENEHDQAMAAYFKACQLMRGCHLPLLYIGLEYSCTNNQNLAERFFTQALQIAPKDPFVLHELGVTAFNNQNYERAEKYLSDALLRVEKVSRAGASSGLAEKWESLLNNLGHTYRKLGRYSEALSFHQQALVLSPLNPSTYSALGYVQTLTNDLTAAVESFHKALGIRREDTFSTNMLNYVIEQLMSEVAPFPGYPEETPRFPPLKSPSGCLNLDTTAGNLSPSATPPLATDSQHTLADTSNLSIDCEMEDTGDTSREQEGLDMDQTL